MDHNRTTPDHRLLSSLPDPRPQTPDPLPAVGVWGLGSGGWGLGAGDERGAGTAYAWTTTERLPTIGCCLLYQTLDPRPQTPSPRLGSGGWGLGAGVWGLGTSAERGLLTHGPQPNDSRPSAAVFSTRP